MQTKLRPLRSSNPNPLPSPASPMPPLSPFLLLLRLVLLHSISTVTSQPSVPPSPSCRPTPCGGVNVTYPFWIASTTDSNSFCGYPNFNLVCNDDTLLSFLFKETYIVLGIDSPNRTISLRDARINSESPDPCPKPSNPSVPSQFRFTKDDVNLTYFFNCSSDSIDVGRIPCRKEKSHVLRSEEITVAKLEGECEEKVMVPALKEAADVEGDLGKVFLDVWKHGFRMEWYPLENCRSCEESGGRCSFQYDNRKGSSILCLCVTGTNVAECRNGGNHLNIPRKTVIAICALVSGFLLAIVAFYVWLKRRPGKLSISPSRNFLFRSESSKPASLVKDMEFQSDGYFHTPIFTYEELEAATGRFDSCKEIGNGGFGIVYKGVLKDGRVVAVKRLHERNYQRAQQFRNEVEILNRIRHPNLVSLYGCTTRDSRELLLVYEYISNGTLADHLHGSRASERLLAWPIRLSIAAETAAALAYLHATEPQIIHRDVKTTNMLLDNSFHVKVADFGISRAFPSPRTTHVSTAPQGTLGYVDPEYHQCYQLTDKSDVYSFGVVLVELISSKPAVDMDRPRSEINLSNMAIAKIPRGLVGELVDANLGYDTDPDVRRTIEAVAELAFRCLQPEKDMRPSMDEVRVTLKKLHNGAERRSSVGEKKARDDTRSLLQSPGVVSLSPDAVVHTWSSRSTFSAVGY